MMNCSLELLGHFFCFAPLRGWKLGENKKKQRSERKGKRNPLPESSLIWNQSYLKSLKPFF